MEGRWDTVIRELIGDVALNAEHHGGLVSPAARHVANLVPATTHHQHRQIEGTHQANAIAIAMYYQ